jgi:hypothetical protein
MTSSQRSIRLVPDGMYGVHPLCGEHGERALQFDSLLSIGKKQCAKPTTSMQHPPSHPTKRAFGAPLYLCTVTLKRTQGLLSNCLKLARQRSPHLSITTGNAHTALLSLPAARRMQAHTALRARSCVKGPLTALGCSPAQRRSPAVLQVYAARRAQPSSHCPPFSSTATQSLRTSRSPPARQCPHAAAMLAPAPWARRHLGTTACSPAIMARPLNGD